MSDRRQFIGFAIAIVVLGVAVVSPPLAGLKPEAQRLGGLFVAGLALWITEALPVGVTALLVIAAQPLLKIATMPAAGAGFMSPVIFFVLGRLAAMPVSAWYSRAS